MVAGLSEEGRGPATPRALRIRDLGAHESSGESGAGRVRSRGSQNARVAVCTKSGHAASRTLPVALRARGCVHCVARVPRPDAALAKGSVGLLACWMCALPECSPLCHRLAYSPLAISINLETSCLWATRSTSNYSYYNEEAQPAYCTWTLLELILVCQIFNGVLVLTFSKDICFDIRAAFSKEFQFIRLIIVFYCICIYEDNRFFKG